jgi:hypothetical protein
MAEQPTATSRSHRLRRDFLTPEFISGTVLVSVVIAIANQSDGLGAVFLITLATMVAFWITEFFAHVIAVQGVRHDHEFINLKASFRAAFRHSIGFLLAAVLPLATLLLGIIGVYNSENAYWIALWTQVVVLAVVGWIAFGGHHVRWYWRIAAALGTAALGVFAILIKILVH